MPLTTGTRSVATPRSPVQSQLSDRPLLLARNSQRLAQLPRARKESVTHRTFKDPQGRIWDVWQVHPSAAERRFSQRRVFDGDRTDCSERRSGEDRRLSERDTRAPVAAEFAYGWLCFETLGEKRRLAPVPEGWDRADDETIEQWCAMAKPAVRRKTGEMKAPQPGTARR